MNWQYENGRIYSTDEKGELMAETTCSYANIWLKRHEKQYPDILSEDTIDQAVACMIDGKH